MINKFSAFHHKTDSFDVGPIWIFAPTAWPRTWHIPTQCRSPWVLGTRRSSWGKPRLNGSNGPTNLAHFIIKLIVLMLDHFGYSPLRLSPGRDLYQPNLGPHGCLEPGGRPGAGRLNGSNGPTKLKHFITNGYSWCWTRLDIRPYGLPQDMTYTSPI